MFAGRVIVKNVLKRAVVTCTVTRTFVVPAVALFQNVNVARVSANSASTRSFMTSPVVSAEKGTSVYVGNIPFDLDEKKLTELLGASVNG